MSMPNDILRMKRTNHIQSLPKNTRHGSEICAIWTIRPTWPRIWSASPSCWTTQPDTKAKSLEPNSDILHERLQKSGIELWRTAKKCGECGDIAVEFCWTALKEYYNEDLGTDIAKKRSTSLAVFTLNGTELVIGKYLVCRKGKIGSTNHGWSLIPRHYWNS